MRALLAAAVALAVLLVAAEPHPHAHPAGGGGSECAVCTLRHAPPSPDALPDVAPILHVTSDAAASPGLPPVSGAPLGAIPGQSPPAGV